MSSDTKGKKKEKYTITKWQALALSSPMIGQAFLMGPMAIVHGIYAKYFGNLCNAF